MAEAALSTSQTARPSWSARARYSSRNVLSGVLFGLGLAAFIDETVFHQILHWHHFYDLGTTDMGLTSGAPLLAPFPNGKDSIDASLAGGHRPGRLP